MSPLANEPKMSNLLQQLNNEMSATVEIAAPTTHRSREAAPAFLENSSKAVLIVDSHR